VNLFDGSDPGKHVGFTVELATTDPDGWPRLALLSAGEIFTVDQTRLRIALWPESHTTANLTRTSRATLTFVHGKMAYNIRLRTCRGENLDTPGPLAVFDGRIIEIRREVAPYAELESGITFSLPNEESTVDRWRDTIAALALHAGCMPSGLG